MKIRQNVAGIYYLYKDTTKEPNIIMGKNVLNDAEDIANLKVNSDLETAIREGDNEEIQKYQDMVAGIDSEEMKKITKEKINQSSQKAALTKMMEEELGIDEEEEITH